MANNSFKYDALPNTSNIRLLRLHESNESKPLMCDLVHVSLDSLPEYNALSYVWGDATDLTTILCNGWPIQVTRNLYSALLKLRPSSSKQSSSFIAGGSVRWANHDSSLELHDSTRITGLERLDVKYLWADAICINQRDMDERKAQVRLMDRIYRQAEQVIIDIGGLTSEIRLALSLLPGVTETLRSIPGEPCKEISTQNLTDYGLPHKRDPFWSGWSQFFSRSWFSRVWIVQEFSLAKLPVFLCGDLRLAADKVISFSDDFIRVFKMGCRDELISRTSNQGLLNMHFMSSTRSSVIETEPRPLFGILCYLKHSLASDARDKVYGFLSLATDFNDPPFEIDYLESAKETYSRMACRLITQDPEQMWSLFDFATGTLPHPELPSWVPNWAAPFEDRTITLLITMNSEYWLKYDGYSSSHALARSSPNFCLHEEDRKLDMWGGAVGKVSRVLYDSWSSDGSDTRSKLSGEPLKNTTRVKALGNSSRFEVGDEIWSFTGVCVPFILRSESKGYSLIGKVSRHWVDHEEVSKSEGFKYRNIVLR
ncbi:MAG: hypothetical protein Q9160_004211 [Pyrenula sp. 1 TL-2023]